MAKGATFFSKILFLLLVLSSFVFGNEARILKPHENSNVLGGFYVAAVKVHGGPSRGGEGHARTNRG